MDYDDLGRVPAIKKQIIEMALNGSGILDTAQIFHISPSAVISELKKESSLESVNHAVLDRLNLKHVIIDIQYVGSAELDERWSYVWNKENPRWLWHAIDHTTGEVLAYILGDRKSALGTVWHHAFTRMVGGATNAIRANLRNNALKNV